MMQSSKGYGQVSGAHGQKKSKFAIVSVASVILVACVVAVAVGVTSRGQPGSTTSGDSPKEVSASVKAIQSICQPTDYKETCVNTLTAAAGSNTTDPKELIGISFKVTIDYIHGVFNQSKVLQEAHKDPRTSHALQNCQELLDYAVDDLQHSFEQLGGFDVTKIHKIIEDLKIWLSAAITYQETCLDGFENTTGDVGASMRKAMNTSAELTGNALAIVNEISSIFTDLKLPFFNRRLLSEEGEQEEEMEEMEEVMPAWVTSGKRRLMQASVDQLKPDVVVAQDGSGKYKTINEALATVPKKSATPYVIYIKEGVYKEMVQIDRSMTNVVMVGDGPTKTKITGNLNFIDGTPTFKTATVAVIGDGFIGKNLGFENSAGPAKHQAVALRVQSDMAIFYNCQMDGYQDTLYVHTHRQFYRDCTISGTIDFIFGNAASIFQNCIMVVRKPMDNQQNIVTAQGRKDRREPTAIILHNCTITADPAYFPFRNKMKSYLGRPWKEYSRTFIMQSQIEDLIAPEGWLPWAGDFGLNTCFYTEFDNRGAGAGMTMRVKWRGIKATNYEHAQQFTVERFLQADRWIKPSGVPYYPGLLPVTNNIPQPSGEPVQGVVGPPATPVPAAGATPVPAAGATPVPATGAVPTPTGV